MTPFQLKIKGILTGEYIIPQSDVNLENRLWERQYVIENENLTEDEAERIRKYKEYGSYPEATKRAKEYLRQS